MTIKNRGGVFGRNPTFNDVDVDGTLSIAGAAVPAPANTLTTSNIGSTVQAYDAATAKTNVSQTFTALQNFNFAGGGNYVATFQTTSTSTPYTVNIGETSGSAAGYPLFRVGQSYAPYSDYFRVNSQGNVYANGGIYIGGTAESDLNDAGDAGVYVEAGGRTKIAATGQEVMQINRSEADTSSRNIILFYRNGANVGKITGDGTSVAYVTSSDYRLKENVTAITDATDRLKQLNPVRFNFIADTTKTVDGFLAHELQAHVPEAVTGIKDGMQDEEYEITPAVFDDDGNEVTPAVMGIRSAPDFQGVDQAKIVPLLVATIKELEARITALEAG